MAFVLISTRSDDASNILFSFCETYDDAHGLMKDYHEQLAQDYDEIWVENVIGYTNAATYTAEVNHYSVIRET